MPQPKFKLWPWATLSLAVPAAAGGAGIVFFNNDPRPLTNDKLWDTAAVFFSVLGAGNGYLIGIAIGDLGRSLFALIIGAASGFGAVHALREPVVGVAYILGLGIVSLGTIIGGLQVISGCATGLMLSIILMFSIAHQLNSPEFHLFVCYPLVCSCITASLPLEWTLASMAGAALSGTRAALHGMLMGVAVFAFFCAIGSSELIVGLGVWAAAIVSNFFCIRSLFIAVYRAERETPVEKASEPENPPEVKSDAV
jgi:hypothetical protein